MPKSFSQLNSAAALLGFRCQDEFTHTFITYKILFTTKAELILLGNYYLFLQTSSSLTWSAAMGFPFSQEKSRRRN